VWKKVGTLNLTQPGEIDIKISLLPAISPKTYRYVDNVFITTDPDYQPRGFVRPPLSREQYMAQAQRLGARESDGYLLRAAQGVQAAGMEWWPRETDEDGIKANPTRSADAVIAASQQLTMAQEMVQPLQVRLRSLSDDPVRIQVDAGALKRNGQEYSGHINWRVIGFAPGSDSRGNWTPWALLRRSGVTVPPLNTAQLWVDVDTRGLPPGDYAGNVTLRGQTTKGQKLPDQVIPLKVHVAPFEIAPRQPVLVDGWAGASETDPYIGSEEYIQFAASHGVNVWMNLMPKAEMQRLGIRALHVALWRGNEQQIAKRIAEIKGLGLDYQDWMFSIMDEPSGTTPEALKAQIALASLVHKVDPKVNVSFNPGEAAKLATFQILDPYTDIWLPYAMHLSFAQDLKAKWAIFSAKPWMWYTTPCYQDKSPVIANTLYTQIRKVPSMPGQCIGTAFFAYYYPWRDPWDARYEHIKDVSAMMLPGRSGPISMPASEAIRAGSQAANLALMVKERAAGGDETAKELIKEGSTTQLITWLEHNKSK
jgi:hypothetical protein